MPDNETYDRLQGPVVFSWTLWALDSSFGMTDVVLDSSGEVAVASCVLAA